MKLPKLFGKKTVSNGTPVPQATNSTNAGSIADNKPSDSKAVESVKPAKLITKDGIGSKYSSEQIDQMVAKSLSQVESVDYITLKIPKQGVIIVVGVTILTMWVSLLLIPYFKKIPLSQFSPANLKTKLASMKSSKESTPSATASPHATASANPNPSATTSAEIKREFIRLRIRNSQTEELGNLLKQKLESFKYQVVDVVYESNQSYEGVQIVVRRDDYLIRQAIMDDLGSSYNYSSSSSAELTTDSDFDAVVILGK